MMIHLHKLPAPMALGIKLASVMPFPKVTPQVADMLNAHRIGNLLGDNVIEAARRVNVCTVLAQLCPLLKMSEAWTFMPIIPLPPRV